MKSNTSMVNNLIAICHIIDDFPTFEERIKQENGSNNNFALELFKVSHGRFSFSMSARKFYAENKDVIDTINMYSNIMLFINEGYGLLGDVKNFSSFYNYVVEHRDELDQILAVLNRIKELGFNRLEFDPTLDFTQKTYQVRTNYPRNTSVEYLDNMEVVPSYANGVVQYKTTGSAFKMILDMHFRSISSYMNEISLNDLTFDTSKLPSDLSKEETFDKIIALQSQRAGDYTAIRNSVDLGIGIADLYVIFDTVYKRINNLTDVDKKDELIALLHSIHETIVKMQNISAEYDQSVVQNNPNISEDMLQSEKDAYVRRREFDKFDLC
ncbi:MAG: hypothetical protein IJO63_03535 [Bacilli bacterium]|nr:hypothetical protein [Bacilli bacterium]